MNESLACFVRSYPYVRTMPAEALRGDGSFRNREKDFISTSFTSFDPKG